MSDIKEEFSLIRVTPTLAAEWLARNKNNRHLRDNVAQRYATDMRNGDWRWTGDPIKFSSDGVLIDGQHRLRAIVITGIELPLLVVHGLDSAAQENVDSGLPRKFFDVLLLRGETNAACLAALVRLVASWENGRRRSITAPMHTVAQLLRVLDQHPELRAMVVHANRIAPRSELSGSLIGLTWWLFARIDPIDATYFFERLADGQGLVKGDSIYALREKLHGLRRDVRSEPSRAFLLAITIKAWNAYREGRSVAVLNWFPGGSRPETFPEPV